MSKSQILPATAQAPLILLVEDDALVRTTLRLVLAAAHYRCVEASSAEEALPLLEAQRPDMAVLDQGLPGLSGIELARILRERFSVPFIFLTAAVGPGIVDDAVKSGAMSYLTKPIDPQNLLPTLQAALMRAGEMRTHEETASALRDAAEANQIISTAVGLVMERYKVSKTTAFNSLRMHARSERRRLVDLATEILTPYDDVNTRLEKVFGTTLKPTRTGT